MITGMTPGFSCRQRLIGPFGWTLLALSGCGRGVPVSGPPPPAQHPVQDLFAYKVQELSAIGSYLPLLDEGRLRAAPPIGWYPASRGQDYVVRFVRDRTQHSPLPRITIEACESDLSQLGELSEKNLKQFCDAAADRLDEETRQALDGDVKPLLLGSVPCAHFVINKQYRVGDKFIRGSRDVIQTLQHGRLYTLSLDVYVGKLIDYRADAFAVMANMEFLVPDEGENKGDVKAGGEQLVSESTEPKAPETTEGDE